MTVVEFLRIEERKPDLELFEGRITEKRTGDLQHVLVRQWFRRAVARADAGASVYEAFGQLRVSFGGMSVVPDVSVFQVERLPVDESGDAEGQVLLAPDAIVELLLPDHSAEAMRERCRRFVAAGVRAALVVDIRGRDVAVIRPRGEQLSVRGDAVVDLTDVIPGLRFTVDELFRCLRLRG
jgi:Uma2 family endonuclease